MNTSAPRAIALAVAFAALIALYVTGIGFAQTSQTSPPPRFENVDANGVDLVTGQFVFKISEGSIGAGDGALSIERGHSNEFGRTDQWSGALYRRTSGGTSLMYLQLGTISDTFTISGSTYTSTKADGGRLVAGGSGFLYIASDGTVVDYQANIDDGITIYPFVGGGGCYLADAGTCALPVSTTKPNGTVFTHNWDFHTKCVGGYDSELNCLQPAAYFRLDGVTSSAGYSFTYAYVTDTPGNYSAPHANWYKRTGATFNNLITAPSPLPSVSYSFPSSEVEELTDTGGRLWRFTTTNNRLTGIRRPGAFSDNITISYNTSGLVSAVSKDGVTTSYSRSVSGTTGTMTVTNALSQVTTVVSDLNIGRITSVTDALSRTTSFQYDSTARLTRTTHHEGDYQQFTYDGRGNMTEVRVVAKSGSNLTDLVATASYPSTCDIPATCNKPTSTTNALGYTTDYTYDENHGGILTITAPAPTSTSGAIRPQTRYTDTLTNGEYRVTGIAACQSSASCAGGADESKTTVAYDAHGSITSVSRGNGTGSLTATVSATYDPIGNLVTMDGPLAGSADSTRFRYNGARQRIGVTSPDPDGGLALKHRATRTTFNAEGLITKIEQGTVDGLTDTNWAAFSPLEAVEIAYDANARPTTQKLTSGGTAYALAQFSYDALGRPECLAQRMNTAIYGSLPSSACTLGTQGNQGPDRIMKKIYDAAGQIIQIKTGLGTSDEANESTTTYSSNGRVATVTDAEGNKTTFEHDGFDRLLKTRYPSPTKGAGTSSTTDYEQLGYDAASNVVSHTLRDGSTIEFTFDRLNRTVAKNLPGSEPDVTYTYDLLGRLTGASQTGNSLTFTYDTLNRQLTQTGPHGTVTSTWDIASRRIQIRHPDGFEVDQDYLVTSEMTKIRENGATSGEGVLATYAYDNLGRRISLSRGNGSMKSFDYDPVSRLSQIVENLSGTTHDQTLGFTYNPAGGIATATRSNDSYAWDEHVNVNRNYASNGLNQYTSTGSITPTYDNKGNLTSAGPTSYGYSSENLLTTASGGITLKYDPMLRLYQTAGGTAGTTRLAYDGANLIAEYAEINGSNVLQHRYVHGPGTDEPIVWYAGSGTTDRRYLHSDERGSIVTVTSSTGSVLAVNIYDEYGIPGANNLGRFQYTGQTWVSDISMYYYKARFYSATLGRFLQPDPIGFGGGMNLYAYAGNDPANGSDPSGLCFPETWAWHWFSSTGEDLGRIRGTNPWTVWVGCDRTGTVDLGGTGGGNGGRSGLPESFSCEAGGGVKISGQTVDGKLVISITGSIKFTGPGANSATNSRYLAALNAAWTVNLDNYSVTTNLSQGPGGVTVNVSAATTGVAAWTDQLRGNTIGVFGLPDILPYDIVNFGILAHEFGHVLGLIDRYGAFNEDGSVIHWGVHATYEKHIMSNNAGSAVDERAIEEMIEVCLRHQTGS